MLNQISLFAANTKGALSKITGVLAQSDVNIYTMLATDSAEKAPEAEEEEEERIVQGEPVILPHLRKKAKVSTVDKVPPVRPESMKSEDPAKDELLRQLWERMLKSGVPDPLIVQGVVAEKDYYDLTVPIRDYDADFIEGCLLEAWDTVNGLCQTKIHDLPF